MSKHAPTSSTYALHAAKGGQGKRLHGFKQPGEMGYPVMVDTTPLPSWLRVDADLPTVTTEEETPPPAEPPDWLEARERQGARNDIVEKIPQCEQGKSRDLAGWPLISYLLLGLALFLTILSLLLATVPAPA